MRRKQKQRWNDWWEGAIKLQETRASSPKPKIIPLQQRSIKRKKEKVHSIDKKKRQKIVQKKMKAEKDGLVQLSVKDLISKFGAKTETVRNGVDRSKRKEGDSMENCDVASIDVQEVEMDNTLKDDEVCEKKFRS